MFISSSGQRVGRGKSCLDARESCFPAGGMQLGTRGLAESLVLEILQTQTDKAQNNTT